MITTTAFGSLPEKQRGLDRGGKEKNKQKNINKKDSQK